MYVIKKTIKGLGCMLLLSCLSCHGSVKPDPVEAQSPSAAKSFTTEQAEAFMQQVEAELEILQNAAERADWVRATYITEDTNALAGEAQERLMAFVGQKAHEAKQADGLNLDPALRRKFDRLKAILNLPAPSNIEQRQQLATLSNQMSALYAKGRVCLGKKDKPNCLSLDELSAKLAKSRNPSELKEIWTRWHEISIPMQDMYARFVELANAGATELGFDNLGTLWNSRYDMPPEKFEAETKRLWEQLKPLYEDLHCYARAKLAKQYGPKVVPLDQPIPAHLLGNMWAQDWSNLFDLLSPQPQNGLELSRALVKAGWKPKDMAKKAEAMFVSLGFGKLPETFYERSLFERPKDRDVVCHASAWTVDQKSDVRIKMCIEPTEKDFTTIYHELGHVYYYLQYQNQPVLFRQGANDGFHEAIGETVLLSLTPGYFKKIGLIKREPKNDLNLLMAQALDAVAFLPFALLVDQWRWGVFSGSIQPGQYNAKWWELRTHYQGIAPPEPRTEKHFDPGAKYHIPANTPYTRYFLAFILKFQIQRALCKQAGHTGPLHTCSLYQNPQATEKFREMMTLGSSVPWTEALSMITGEEQLDASALLQYFEPLQHWLKENNKKQKCGW